MGKIKTNKLEENIGFTKILVNFLIAIFMVIPISVFAETRYEYSYTGAYQEFVCPKDGVYKIQLWGAQGGNYDTTLLGGLGGYTEGNIKIKKGDKLYFYVGGQPSAAADNYTGGWNGGGNTPENKNQDGRAGGGATDVRTIKTSSSDIWNESKSLKSRIMVAAGGGGAYYYNNTEWYSDGGAAGGLTGLIPSNMGSLSSAEYGTGGTQTSGGYAISASDNITAKGTFGKGGDGITIWGSGGGGGYYGGGASNDGSGGGGGSSYISGHEGCTGKPTSSEDYIFSGAKIIDGKGYLWTTKQTSTQEKQPSPLGNGTQIGNSGNGYAIIEFVRDLSNTNTLTDLTTNIGTISPNFDENTFEYTLTLEKDQREVTITATPKDEGSIIIGDGVRNVSYDKTNTIEVIVTSESGLTQIYQITANRKGLEDGTHTSELADLDLFDNDTKEKISLNKAFASGSKTYSTTISLNTASIDVNATPYDEEATVTVEGADVITGDRGTIKVIVTEPNSARSTYNITYTREKIKQTVYNYQEPGRYEFTAPASTWYKIQLWGAQGGQMITTSAPKNGPGGPGAYTEGEIFLEKGTKLFFYIGGQGEGGTKGGTTLTTAQKCVGGTGGYNGGGNGGNITSCTSSRAAGGGGGGASDVRLVDAPDENSWDDFESLKSRIMVAAGGGGGSSSSWGYIAGKQIGYPTDGNFDYEYATQTNGYAFGIGQDGISQSTKSGGGSGGGYFGGCTPLPKGGNGGSSFASGCNQCFAIDETSTQGNIIMTDSNIHYSGLSFDHIVVLSGDDPLVDANGELIKDEIYARGNLGDGYGKISMARHRSNNNYLSSLTTSSGSLSPSFSPTTQKYDLELDSEVEEIELSATLADQSAAVSGLGKYKIKYGENRKVIISVTNEIGEIRVYEVNIHRKELADTHSSKISSMTFKLENEEDIKPILSPAFHSDTLEYSITISSSLLFLDFDVETFDKDATVKKEGTDKVLGASGDLKIIVSAPGCEDTTYTIHYTRESTPSRDAIDYEPTGNYQTFTAPANGKYRVELWGSQGNGDYGGGGAYTKGEIILKKDEKLYVYVGDNQENSFNGGSHGFNNEVADFLGGGATDVRLTPGNWDNFDSLKSRIMVAAGGGGTPLCDVVSGVKYFNGGAAGGLFSYDVPYCAGGKYAASLNTGATQTIGGYGREGTAGYLSSKSGQFGVAGRGNTLGYGGGAGGGYYGGAGGGTCDKLQSAGSGGSSYISGHIGSNSILEHSVVDHIFHSGNEIHYSNKYFTNTQMIDGLGYSWVDDKGPSYTPASEDEKGTHAVLLSEYTGQPKPDTGEIEEGHTGEGYARITPLFPLSNNNYLASLTSDVGTLSPEFVSTTLEYDLILDKEDRVVNLSAEVSDSTAFVTGVGKYIVRYKEGTTANIAVTSESGETRIYKVNMRRTIMPEEEHSSKIADLDFIVDERDVAPNFEPDFQPNVFEYSVTLSQSMIMLDVDAVLFDPEATIVKEGTGLLKNEGDIKITVSEPHCDDTVYIIHYKKIEVEKEYTYEATGNYQTFIAPIRGNYRFELWGSAGSNITADKNNIRWGGFGAYTKGDILLDKDEKLYLYVGNVYPQDASFNGGGDGSAHAGAGGGATDVRLTPGAWDDFNSLKSRIMVAAGGGGATAWRYGSNGGSAGGLFSYDIPYQATQAFKDTVNTGATQTSGGVRFINEYGCDVDVTSTNVDACGFSGEFGIGGNGDILGDGAGAGGGYYGGAGGGEGSYIVSSGSGGSSYISGHLGCDSIAENSTQNKITHTGSNIHYSGKYFTNTEMIDGLGYKWVDETGPTYKTPNNKDGNHVILADGEYTGQPTIDGSDIQEGNYGEGYIKITPLLEKSRNNYLLELKSNYGKFDKEYDPFVTDYTLNLDKYEQHFTLSGVLADSNATVVGLDTKYEVPLGGTRVVTVVVTAPNGEVRNYKVTAKRGDFAPGEHSTKLEVLNLNNGMYTLDPDFISIVEDYELSLPYSAIALDVDAIPYDEEATVKIEGNGYLKDDNNTIKITITHPDVETTVYTIKVKREESIEGQKWEFACTNSYQEFVVPASTYYRVQLWGARGGYGRTNWALKYRGGHGAYTEGEVYLPKGKKVYVYVGCEGKDASSASRFVGGEGGWNGGAKGGDDSNKDSAPEPGGGGGGATDIRLIPTTIKTEWKDFRSLKSRIMVAAGGGGGCYSGLGGAGGTLEGLRGYGSKMLATQTQGYAFGYGQLGANATAGTGGGGSGYYGGASNGAGGGGSSFVSGCEGCVAIAGSSITEDDLTSSDSNIHYSGYAFDKIEMYSGEDTQPSPKGGYQTGNGDDGYTIITAAKNRSENNFLSEITVDKGTLSPEYNPLTKDYTVKVNPDDTSITIDAKLDDETATMTGTGTFDVPAGKTQFSITVTAENGSVRIYTVTVEREKSSNPYPLNIEIKGLIPNLCSVNSSYCNLTPGFNPDTNSYSITVPGRIDKIEFVVTKANKYQTVIGDGEVTLEKGLNTFTIEVVSEDEERSATYTFSINRDMSGDANISKLEVTDPETDIGFDPDTLEYRFSVPNSYTKVGLNVELQDPESTYKVIGNENFEVGLNVVKIEVTAENNEKKTYVLNIYREQNGNTFLSNLKVTHNNVVYSLVPTFNKIYNSYVVNVPNEIEKATIEATPEHTLTTIKGDGEKTLRTGTNTFSITATAENGDTNIYTVSIVRAKGSDATLKSLDVAEASLSPSFESLQETYDVEVSSEITSLTLNPVPNDPNAKIRITGNSGFRVGKNVVYITVTAEDGTKKTYTINVTKKASDNNYLSSLVMDQYDLSSEFDKEVEEYNITLDNSITQIKVSATPEDSKARVSGTGTYNLRIGDNQVEIPVTAQNGDVRVYTINITVSANANSNLLSLTTSSQNDYTPDFDPSVTEYTLEVPNEEDRITVLGVSEDEKATVSGNDTYYLNVGDNTIQIVVTAEDGVTKTTYTLTVHRKASSNANISLLIAEESALDPEFNKDKLEYELKVLERVTWLTLHVDLEDPNATYEVIGNEDFEMGHNTVTVKVTAEDGVTTKEYVLDVLRQEQEMTSNRLIRLEINQGVLDPPFEPDINYYEVVVENEVVNIALDGEPEDKEATVSGFENYPLKVGKNPLAVTVTSTDGIVRYYQVIVTRKGSSEARLSKLEVANHMLTPSFDKDTYEYSITTDLEKLEITAETLDKNATVEILGNENLALGDNQVIIRVTAEDGVTTKDYILNVTKGKSNNNYLKSLTLSGTDYTPEFVKTTTVYKAYVDRDINNLQIEAIPEDSRASVSGDGEASLSLGVNYIDITVTSEAGSKRVYTLIITRGAGTNNYLSSLIPSYGSFLEEFDKERNDYTMMVPYEVEDIVFSGTPEDFNATVVGFDKYDLKVGDNEIPIIVTAENGDSNIYTVTVTRENIVSSLLEDIKIKGYKLDQSFASEVFDYTVTIDYEVTELDLTAIPLDKGATYEIKGNSNFVVGMNTIEIEVTDSLGVDTSTYTLNVNRQNYANTFLAYIYTDHGELTPLFDKEQLEYEVIVDSDIDTIDLRAEPEVPTNTLTGTGTYSLEPGDNEFALTVTNPDGIKRTYYVNVIRKQDDSNDLTSLKVKANEEEQTLDPEFDKDTLKYSVTVPPSTSKVEILATTAHNASISGLGVRLLKTGDNVFNVTVTSEAGTAKIYTITIHKDASDNNYLASLVPSAGTLEPNFNKKGQEYTLKLDSSVTTLSFTATAEDPFATISGTEVDVVSDGESVREIVVTAEDKTTRTYTVNVVKEVGDEARLKELRIPNYPFEETFDKDILTYTVSLPQSKQELIDKEVIAIPLDSEATVKKLEKLELSSDKENIYDVEVTAKDGVTKKLYRIKIKLVEDIDITKITLDDELILGVGEEVELLPVFEPENATNKELEYTSSDTNIVTVEYGIVTGIKEGEATITVSSKRNPTVKKEIKVKVINLKITSQVYDVRRDEVNLFDQDEIKDIIIGAEPNESLTDFIGNLDNDASLIKIYNRQNQLITDLDNNVVTTGYKIHLEFKDKVYDSVYLVVRGDSTQDGIIDIDDNALTVGKILMKATYDPDTLVFKAMDVVETEEIDIDDTSKLNRYILKKEQTLN